MEHGTQSGLSWSSPEKPVKKSMPESTPQAANEPVASHWLAGAFVVGVILGVIAGWSFGAYINPANQKSTATAPAPAPKAAKQSAPAQPVQAASVPLSLSGTQPAGERVAIDSMAISSPTWVVVYDSRGGEPGNALGAQLFGPESKSGAITLLRPTLAGQTYFVGERRDNGDRLYSPQSDRPVLMQDGSPLLVQFSAH